MTQRLSTMNLPFLRKPYRIEALSQAIDTALEVSRYGEHRAIDSPPSSLDDVLTTERGVLFILEFHEPS